MSFPCGMCRENNRARSSMDIEAVLSSLMCGVGSGTAGGWLLQSE